MNDRYWPTGPAPTGVMVRVAPLEFCPVHGMAPHDHDGNNCIACEMVLALDRQDGTAAAAELLMFPAANIETPWVDAP